jgi:hypothetical protein
VRKMSMFGPNQQRGWNIPREKSSLMMPRAEPTESLTPSKLLAPKRVTPRCGITDLPIQGLLDRLPKPNGIWSLDDRAKWLRTAASIFGLVYKASDGEHREICIRQAGGCQFAGDSTRSC